MRVERQGAFTRHERLESSLLGAHPNPDPNLDPDPDPGSLVTSASRVYFGLPRDPKRTLLATVPAAAPASSLPTCE